VFKLSAGINYVIPFSQYKVGVCDSQTEFCGTLIFLEEFEELPGLCG
jgi:hypothetical protein